MKRLEIIHLRSSGEPLDSLGRRIRESIAEETAETVTLYRRQGLDTDLAVHIRHRTATEGQLPSDLGLRLASSLRTYGLVEHTVWEELTIETPSVEVPIPDTGEGR